MLQSRHPVIMHSDVVSPRLARRPLLAMFRLAGALGVWPGLYAVAALSWMLHLTRAVPNPPLRVSALLFVFLATTGAYLLDRIKLRHAWIDPADQLGQPQRYEILLRHERLYRALAFGMLLLAAIVGSTISRWAVVAVALTVIGIVAYAPTPRGRVARPKDLFLLKNLYTALGLAGFVALTEVSFSQAVLKPAGLLVVGLLTCRILIDAALCDTDDIEPDKISGTRTLPLRFGAGTLRRVGFWCELVLAGVVLLAPFLRPEARIGWGTSRLLGALALLLIRPSQMRDFIDLRFPAEVIFAIMLTFALDAMQL
jgi:4-hydroxybenzoate polyprenyltransferase